MVEVAGQQLMEILPKLNCLESLNWVEALPQVLDRLHDVPGESGYSPYQILFGRERSLGNLPYFPATECPDAVDFFNRTDEIDKAVSTILNGLHKRKDWSDNKRRKEPPEFFVGDKVWHLRPENSGTKLDTRWLGPCKVVSKTSMHGYEIRVDTGDVVAAHATFLKKHVEDRFSGLPTPLCFHQRTVVDTFAAGNEWVVDEILDHRVGHDGKWEFKTRWKGHAENETSWEHINSFFHRSGFKLVKYCQAQDLDPPVTRFLQPEPTQE